MSIENAKKYRQKFFIVYNEKIAEKYVKKERKMYKIVTIDLDGTLLNSFGEISEENLEN